MNHIVFCMKYRFFWYINIGYLVEFYMLFLPDNIYTVNPYGGHLGPGQMNILHIYQWCNIPIIQTTLLQIFLCNSTIYLDHFDIWNLDFCEALFQL